MLAIFLKLMKFYPAILQIIYGQHLAISICRMVLIKLSYITCNICLAAQRTFDSLWVFALVLKVEVARKMSYR